MVIQDVQASQRGDPENQRQAETRLVEAPEAFGKFEEEQQTFEFVHPRVLRNWSVGSQEDPHPVQQMIAPILYSISR